jgi:hypothetical protein
MSDDVLYDFRRSYMIHLFWKYRNGNEDFTRKETIKLSKKKHLHFLKMEVFEELTCVLQQN